MLPVAIADASGHRLRPRPPAQHPRQSPLPVDKTVDDPACPSAYQAAGVRQPMGEATVKVRTRCQLDQWPPAARMIINVHQSHWRSRSLPLVIMIQCPSHDSSPALTEARLPQRVHYFAFRGTRPRPYTCGNDRGKFCTFELQVQF